MRLNSEACHPHERASVLGEGTSGKSCLTQKETPGEGGLSPASSHRGLRMPFWELLHSSAHKRN